MSSKRFTVITSATAGIRFSFDQYIRNWGNLIIAISRWIPMYFSSSMGVRFHSWDASVFWKQYIYFFPPRLFQWDHHRKIVWNIDMVFWYHSVQSMSPQIPCSTSADLSFAILSLLLPNLPNLLTQSLTLEITDCGSCSSSGAFSDNSVSNNSWSSSSQVILPVTFSSSDSFQR